MIAAETAARAWINAQTGLVGDGMPLAMGAFLDEQRSPASGAYAVIHRELSTLKPPIAEDGRMKFVRIAALVYAGTETAAEMAAQALADRFRRLTGCPEPMGSTGVTVLCHDNLSEPVFIGQPEDNGEQYCFSVAADLLMYE